MAPLQYMESRFPKHSWSLCNTYCEQRTWFILVTEAERPSEWPLPSPIIEALDCRLNAQSHVFFILRPWAAVNNKPILDKKWFSAIMLSLPNHIKFAINTTFIHRYMLTDHICVCKSSVAVNKTKIKGTNVKTPLKRSQTWAEESKGFAGWWIRIPPKFIEA